jgi:hypothetical protein
VRTAETINVTSKGATSFIPQALTWAGASALAVPAAVLLHELGHFASHLIFGFKGTTLHYSSTIYELERPFWQQVYRGDFQAAAGILPLWKVAAATAAGLLVTYAVVVACCFVVSRHRSQPFVVGLGLVSPLRFVSGVPSLVALIRGRTLSPGTDEANLALLTGVPSTLLILLGLAVLFGGWFWLIRTLPREQRAAKISGLLVGVALGMVVYFKFAGPLLLP